CVGYIVDEQYWPQLRRKLKAREARKQKIKELQKRARALKKELGALAANGAVKKNAAVKKAPKRRKV
ncbi:MAG TPA: hypothetical protein VD994_15625, partial [Prosthecobacter sp.]|nr:hypothetical protein [Prosthecobacter sp.]